MDFWIILALMFVLYIVPEILKRRRPKKYEYPEVPGPQPAPRQDRPQPRQAETPARPGGRPDRPKSAEAPEFAMPRRPGTTVQLAAAMDEEGSAEARQRLRTAMPPEVHVPSTVVKDGAWHGTIDRSLVLNGIIFSEIIGPPRSKQPVPVCRPRRK